MKKEEKARAPASNEIRMSMTRMKARKMRKRRITLLVCGLSALSVILVIVVIAVFFKVKTVEVTGNVKYKAQDIIEASGIEKGDGILSAGGLQVENKLKKSFPAIEEVRIKKQIPSGIVIDVKESEEVMFAAFGEHYYSFDKDLRVVESYDSIEMPELLGMKRIYISDITKCITGSKLETAVKDIPEMVTVLYENLVKNDLFGDVGEIDFRDKFDIRFTIDVKYTIVFGNILECETKLEILDGILKKVGDEYIGTIDLSSGNIKEVTMSRS